MINKESAMPILRKIVDKYPGFPAFFRGKVDAGQVQFKHGNGIDCGCFFVWLGVFSGERDKAISQHAFCAESPKDAAVMGYLNVTASMNITGVANPIENTLHEANGPRLLSQWMDEIQGVSVRPQEPSAGEFIDIERMLQEIESTTQAREA